MARSTSDEELKLRKRARRRLIGAIALTTLVVVTLPMVLDNEPRPIGDDIAVQIPSPNSGPYAPRAPGADAAVRAGTVSPAPAKAGGSVGAAAPAVADPASSPASAPVPSPAPGAAATPRVSAAAPSSATPADQKIEMVGASRPAAEAASTAAALAAEAKSAAEAAAAARATAARAAEAKAAETKVAEAKASEARAAEAKGADAKDAEAKSFVIQLGAFSDVSRAKDRHGQLVKAGIRSYTEVIKTPTGDKTRVRAGPFPSRQAAEQANERVKALGMTDGIVVPRRY